MILACRPGHVETCDEIKRQSGSAAVEMMEVDLADFLYVHEFCNRLARRNISIDIALMNAGLMPRKEDLVSYNLHCHSKMGAVRGLNSHKRKIN